MNAIAGIRMKNPAHPGSFIKHEIIEPLELTITAAAGALGVTRATLSTLLNERAHLSPEMALRVEKAFGVSMDTLMRMHVLQTELAVNFRQKIDITLVQALFLCPLMRPVIAQRIEERNPLCLVGFAAEPVTDID